MNFKGNKGMNENFDEETLSSEEDKKKCKHLKQAIDIFEDLFAESSIESPRRKELLELAKKGKNVWNAWRESYPKAPVILSGINFKDYHPSLNFSDFIFFFAEKEICKSECPNVDFGGCTFSTNNKFDRCIFDGETNFRSAKFEGSAHFNKSIFRHEVSFERASFSGDSFFCGAEFFGEASFNGATFERYANFRNSVFHSNSSFVSTEFIRDANFDESIFHSATFDEVKFGDNTRFENAKITSGNFNLSNFGSNISFYGAYFKEIANFTSAKFKDKAVFDIAVFEGPTLFCFSSFGKFSSFRRSSFIKDVDFSNASFNDHIDFSGANFECNIDFSANPNESKPFGHNHLGYVSFAGTEFKLGANFSGRNFTSTTNFGFLEEKFGGNSLPIRPVMFFGVPNFHGCKFSQDTSFDSAEFTAPPSPEAARAYRTLKLAMEQLKATREEQKFFRLEMKAEHPSLPRGKRWISTLYSVFSDYGFSLWRPLVWLLALSLLFGIGYGILANACASDTECAQIAWVANTGSAADRTSAVIKYTLASVSPVPGLDKMQTELRAPLFGHHGWISITALMLEILQKIVALVMAFLFALAVRNLFKMKS